MRPDIERLTTEIDFRIAEVVCSALPEIADECDREIARVIAQYTYGQGYVDAHREIAAGAPWEIHRLAGYPIPVGVAL